MNENLILYKYMSKDTFLGKKEYQKKSDGYPDIYTEGKLYFVELKHLNDPLEGLPKEVFSDNNKRIRNAFEKSLESCKICSLSSSPDNDALWAYYAENHTGICFGFRIEHLKLREEYIECAKMNYSDKFLVRRELEPFMSGLLDETRGYILSPENVTKLHWELIKKVLTHKTSNWEKEDEWRLMKPSGEQGFYEIGELKEVILGYNCELSDSELCAFYNKQIIIKRRRIGVAPSGDPVLQNRKSGDTENRQEKLENLYKRSAHYYVERNYAKAIEYSNLALLESQNSPEIYNLRGMIYFAKPDLNKAIADFSKALELGLNSDDETCIVYLNRGGAYAENGDDNNAIADFEQIIKLKSDDTEANFNLGELYFRKSDYDNALKFYSSVSKNTSMYVPALIGSGCAYFNKGEYGKSIEKFDEALELDATSPKVYYNRGTAYAYLREYEKAIADFDKAIELKPDYEEARKNRDMAYVNLHKHDNAIGDYDKKPTSNPNDADTNSARSFTGSDIDESLVAFDETLNLKPDETGIIYAAQALAYVENGDLDNAINSFKKALERDPNNYLFYLCLGNAYADKGSLDEALANFNESLRLNPDSAEAFNDRSKVFLIQGKLDKAIKDCKESLRIDPNNEITKENLRIALELKQKRRICDNRRKRK